MSAACDLSCPSTYEQVCYKCRGDVSTCCTNYGDFDSLSGDDCVSNIDGLSVVSVHFNPDTLGCAHYSCDTNTYFTDSNRWQMRLSDNPGEFSEGHVYNRYIQKYCSINYKIEDIC